MINKKKISVKLRLCPVYLSGRDVEVTVEVKNNEEKAIRILRNDRMLGSDMKDCFEIIHKNQMLPYDGMIVKRQAYTDEDHVLLQSGESLKIKADISRNYLLREPGFYTVKFRQNIFYQRELVPGLFGKVRSSELTHAAKGFFLIGKREKLRLSLGEEARQSSLAQSGQTSTDNGNVYYEPIIRFKGGEKKYTEKLVRRFKSETTKAYYEMLHYLNCSLQELNAGEAEREKNLHYKMVFGEADEARYEKVKEVFDKTIKALQRTQGEKEKGEVSRYAYIYDGDRPDTWFGYTFKGSTAVYLCKAYIRAPLTGCDSKIGTLFHELTHAVADTDDCKNKDGQTCYGRKLCRRLAIEEPGMAVRNADSYEFFMESKFLCRMKEEKWPGTEAASSASTGGPAVICDGEKLYLFFADESGAVCRSGYVLSTGDFEPPTPLEDKEKNPFLSLEHPRAIVKDKKIYLFFLEKESGMLCVSEFFKEAWSTPVPLSENKICSSFWNMPKPFLYDGKIAMIYTVKDKDDLRILKWDGTRAQETVLQRASSLEIRYAYNPSVCVYEDKVYLFYQNETVGESENRRILIGILKKKKDGEEEIRKLCPADCILDVNSDSIVYAAGNENAVCLTYYRKDADNAAAGFEARQIQMNKNVWLKNRIIWTDNEGVRNSSDLNCDYKLTASCDSVESGNYNYLVYQKPGKEGIFLSCQMRY